MASLAFVGCSNEEDDFFSKSAADRLNDIKADYSAKFQSAKNGWIMQYFPTTEIATNGVGQLMVAKFNANQTVTLSRYQKTFSGGSVISATSLWEMIADDGPVLSFNSYNKVLHYFSDPATTENGTFSTGKGYEGDYEFVVVDAPADGSYVKLKGKKRSAYTLLLPLDSDVTDSASVAAYLLDVENFKNKYFSSSSPSSNYLHVGDSAFVMDNISTGIPTFYPEGGDATTQSSSNTIIVFKKDGSYYLRFRDELTLGGQKSQLFKYNADTDQFDCVDNPACSVTGDSPAHFFETVFEKNLRWSWNNQSQMSAGYAAIYKALQDEFTSKGYTFQGACFRPLSGNNILRVTYKGKRQSQPTNIDYKFTFSREGDDVTFSGLEGTSTGAVNMYNSMASLKNFVDFFAQKLTIAGDETKFNLNTVKMVSSANPDLWLVVGL